MILRGFVVDDFFDDVADDIDDVQNDAFYTCVYKTESILEHSIFTGQDDAKLFVAVKPEDEAALAKCFNYPIVDIDENEYPWDSDYTTPRVLTS